MIFLFLWESWPLPGSFPASGTRRLFGRAFPHRSPAGRQRRLAHGSGRREAGIQTLFVPAENAAEATLAGGLTVYGVPDVAALARASQG